MLPDVSTFGITRISAVADSSGATLPTVTNRVRLVDVLVATNA